MWYQLQIKHCEEFEVDHLSSALEETGCLSITLTDKNDDPVLEPAPGTTPLWPEVVINALYAEEAEAQQALDLMICKYPSFSFTINALPDQDWERAWMDDFKPQCFGRRLWICPSWMEPPEPNAVNLRLDPGLAFGTGTHPTTNLCLSWLDQAALEGKKLIDYGCGSGILALAALKLGASKVQAVDIDPQALQATKANALSNDLLNSQLEIGEPEALEQPVDIIMANILLAPLMSLHKRFYELLKIHGILVLSGLLREQVPELLNSYQKHCKHQQTVYLDDWALVVFSKS